MGLVELLRTVQRDESHRLPLLCCSIVQFPPSQRVVKLITYLFLQCACRSPGPGAIYYLKSNIQSINQPRQSSSSPLRRRRRRRPCPSLSLVLITRPTTAFHSALPEPGGTSGIVPLPQKNFIGLATLL
jgi:hypothetical protein